MFSLNAQQLKTYLDDIRNTATDLTIACQASSFQSACDALTTAMEAFSRSKQAERRAASVLELRQAVVTLIQRAVEVDQQLREMDDLALPLRVVLRLCNSLLEGNDKSESASSATVAEAANVFLGSYRKFVLFLRELGNGDRSNREYVAQVKSLLASLSELDLAEASCSAPCGDPEALDQLKRIIKGAVLLSREYAGCGFPGDLLEELAGPLDSRVQRAVARIKGRPPAAAARAAKWGQLGAKVERVAVMGEEGATWDQLTRGGLIADHEGNRPLDAPKLSGSSQHKAPLPFQSTTVEPAKLTERDFELEDIEAMMEFADQPSKFDADSFMKEQEKVREQKKKERVANRVPLHQNRAKAKAKGGTQARQTFACRVDHDLVARCGMRRCPRCESSISTNLSVPLPVAPKSKSSAPKPQPSAWGQVPKDYSGQVKF